MKVFNEAALIAGICSRDQDARDIKKLFNPNWLKDAELKPILMHVFNHMEEEKSVPSLDSLSEYMKEKDEEMFKNRWKATVDQLRGIDEKVQVRAIKGAKDAAATYSLHYLLNEARFQQMITDGNAEGVKKDLSEWISKHSKSEDEGLFSIQEAMDKLVDDFPWQGRQRKITTGLKPIDDWSGGLRAPQMGIIAAPTGHGKSAALMNVGLHDAAIENKVVLFITNELTVNEQTERFAARMKDPKLDPDGKFKYVTMGQIQEDATLGHVQLTGYRTGLNTKLFIYSSNLGQTVKDLDEVCIRLRNERGVWPDVIVIDYMERMNAVEKMSRDQTWTYFGQIAKELVWLAKRRNCVIWTAVQTNRGGAKDGAELGIEHIQGSIQHIQEASYLVSIKKVMVTDGSGKTRKGMEFKEHKSRHGAMDGRKMIVEADLERMYISTDVIESIKDIQDDDDKIARPTEKPALNRKKR